MSWAFRDSVRMRDEEGKVPMLAKLQFRQRDTAFVCANGNDSSEELVF